jgi:hypothetical protein
MQSYWLLKQPALKGQRYFWQQLQYGQDFRINII